MPVPAQITFLLPSMLTPVLMLISTGVPLPFDPWERSRELWSAAIIDVAISVSLDWRCFCAVCNTAVAEVMLFVVGDGGVVDCAGAGSGCWDPVPEVIMMVLLFPCTLMDASMWIVMGLGLVVLVSQLASSSSISISSLWISLGPEFGDWDMEYGGGGVRVS